MIGWRVGTVIPSLTSELSQLDSINSFDFSVFLMSNNGINVHTFFWCVLWEICILLILFYLLSYILSCDFLVCFADPIEGHPLVHSSINALVVNVVLIWWFHSLLRSIIVFSQATLYNSSFNPSVFLKLSFYKESIVHRAFV